MAEFLSQSGGEERRESFPIPGARGGHVLGVGWFHKGTEPRPLLVCLHGVAGSSEAPYMVRAAQAAFRAGYHVLRLNARGAGETFRHTHHLSHAGLTEDVRIVVEALAKDPRVQGVYLLGFSLGGNAVLKAVGEWSGDVPGAVKAAASVSAPMDLGWTVSLMERWRAAPYALYVLAGLKAQALRFRRGHPHDRSYSLRKALAARTIREYDEAVVVPMHGFRDTADYYEQASSGPWLRHIALPTLVVHAEDDPMVPADTVTPSLLAKTPAVETDWSPGGGHLGWVGGVEPEHWVENWAMGRVLRFFARHR